jgi:dynein heavy chain
VEKKLLEQQIKKLDHQMNKGRDIHNWFSLSIKEFIVECNRAIDEFKVVKNNVLQSAHNIEKKVLNIQNAVILREIDFGIKEPMEISEFMEFFDSHTKKVLAELEKDYQNIGDQDLKQIEAATVSSKSDAGSHELKEEMRPYFQYWERRIFNAITKMIIRAMAAAKTLFTRT